MEKRGVCIYDERSAQRCSGKAIRNFIWMEFWKDLKDNQIPTESVMETVKRTRQEVKKEKNRYAR